jgi:hypothetical protein
MYTQAWYSVDTSSCKSGTEAPFHFSTATLDLAFLTNLTYMLPSNL